MRTFPPCSTTWPSMTPYGTPPSFPERVLNSTDKLAEFPRLYEAAPEYGEGVRRISLAGQHVLYEVDDQEQIVRVLAVVGQRQNPRRIKGEP